MVDICDCDVQNKEALAVFRSKIFIWNNLIYKDPLCISNQINSMIRNDSIFRIFNEARKLASNQDGESFGFNSYLLNLIDYGFIESQVMAIRRLTDRNFNDPKKAVISLRRIIDDMSAHNDIITRENYVSHDGDKYENVPLGDNQIINYETRHTNFDKLCNVSANNRSRSDCMNENIFNKLNQSLNICHDLRTYANKFIAHTSDLTGRLTLTEKQKEVTLDNLNRCYQAIIRVSSFIGQIILYEEELGGIPCFKDKYLQNLEKPMVAKDDFKTLRSFWNTRETEVNQWNENLWSIIN